MLQKKSVIIVGAGASKEYGLLSGVELKDRIKDFLNYDFKLGGFGELKSGNQEILEAIRNLAKVDNTLGAKYFHSALRISRAMSQATSIDSYIETQNDELIEQCGKLAIVQAILDSERQSKLCINKDYNRDEKHFNFSAIEDTWLTEFFRLVTESCRKEDLEERLSNVGFIIFNYDRCVEHYLYHAFQNFYDIHAEKSAELINQIEIYHPYGVVGQLDWQEDNQDRTRISFGGEAKTQDLIKLSKQIKTFSESTKGQESEIASIRELILSAEIVTFLGFAFHNQNMKLLFNDRLIIKEEDKKIRQKCFATAYDVSESDVIDIKRVLSNCMKLMPQRAEVRSDCKCTDLFKEYSRSFSLS